MAESEHHRSSMRFGHDATVWCRCGWQVEVRGESGDDASRKVREAYDEHLAGTGGKGDGA